MLIELSKDETNQAGDEMDDHRTLLEITEFKQRAYSVKSKIVLISALLVSPVVATHS